ncbi:unnamed protein product [Menidia menidia]|uniref:(Atlantic silverside) hypothetical protein n=1 Tax=Menidia menidia TaxID=238744 RepID=A0A8S4BK97_9TELE|nr:unnamed protein product [Menidia menidia]
MLPCYWLLAGFNEGFSRLPPGPCIGDTLSSSPCSTPMGSLESLSSHSSEQNPSSKAGPPPTDPRTPVGVSSPESSSREEANRTDVESEDALSLSSLPLSDGRRSCSGSAQSLSTLESKESLTPAGHPDLPPKQVIRRRMDTSVANGYQRPGSV